jgi:hypothetical protein
MRTARARTRSRPPSRPSNSSETRFSHAALDLSPRPFRSEELAFLRERADEVVDRLEAWAREEAVS